MIRHRERSPWLLLSLFLSDHAGAITNAADHLGGPALAKQARSVIDDVRLGQVPTRRLIAAIERLCTELDARSKSPAGACRNTRQASVEQDFAVRAEISALVDKFRDQVGAFRMGRVAELAACQLGVS